MVGVTGFEPATSSSRTKRATKLRYTPISESETELVSILTRHLKSPRPGGTPVGTGTPVGIRTPNLLIRSQALYPVELRVLYAVDFPSLSAGASGNLRG